MQRSSGISSVDETVLRVTTECTCGHTMGWHVQDVPAGACSIWACYCEKYEVAK
jgi:hypothetical protein